MNKQKKILIFGSTGMLGHTLLRFFLEKNIHNTIGTIRFNDDLKLFPEKIRKNIISNIDIENEGIFRKVFNNFSPDIVINCVGLIRHLKISNDPVKMISVNSLFPHLLSRLCSSKNAKLIQFSTDCIFSGTKGMYTEIDLPDGVDLYAKSKFLGEVNASNQITIRSSFIGHEIKNSLSLLEWFLAEKHDVKGYTKAIFSGLTTLEMAKVIHDFIIPYDMLEGIYNISAEPISKYDLLNLIARVYSKSINIIPDSNVNHDLSLDSGLFRSTTGYIPPKWDDLIKAMYSYG
jgi:dTDP-4-dehydrorhamnose reductase